MRQRRPRGWVPPSKKSPDRSRGGAEDHSDPRVLLWASELCFESSRSRMPAQIRSQVLAKDSKPSDLADCARFLALTRCASRIYVAIDFIEELSGPRHHGPHGPTHPIFSDIHLRWLPFPGFASTRECCIATPARALQRARATSRHHAPRSLAVVGDRDTLVRLASCVVLCPTQDRDRVAARPFS